MRKTEVEFTIILFNLFFILFIIGIFVFIKQYKLKKKEHQGILTYQKEQHQKEILNTQIEIQNQTMQHIGREIHDNVGQKLTLASLYIQQLSFENKAPQISESIEIITKIINESISELRELSKSLTYDSINDYSIFDLILLECEKVRKAKKCKISFDYKDINLNLNYQQKSILLRICQEFIQNSIKHAHCKNIQINISNTNEILYVNLSDDGIGFNTTIKNEGIGLENIKTRTLLLKGNFELKSNLNIGTSLSITIPLYPNVS